VRRCIFCHQPLARNRAREHVLPRWLEREIGGEFAYYSHPIEGDTSSAFTLLDTDVVSATAGTRVEGRVCRACNGTWLSSLEVAAQPVVSNLVFGRAGMDSLSAGERELLATWLYKTLLVGVSSGSGEYEVHGCDYHEFRTTGQPGNWMNIYAAVLESTCGGFCGPAEMKWPPPSGRPSGGPDLDSSDLGLKWVMHIGRLHVVVCHTAVLGATQVVLEGLHVPIWTPQAFVRKPGRLAPRVAADSLVQWLAFGLTPTLEFPAS
jgi:hypothetical protein